MRLFCTAVVAGLLLSSVSAAATPPMESGTSMARASQGSEEEVINTVTDEKVICRRDKAIGSRVNARRVCMTAKDWAKKTAEERQFVEQRQQQLQKQGN